MENEQRGLIERQNGSGKIPEEGMTDGKGKRYWEERMKTDDWQIALTRKEALKEGK
jgi:hypothetical protein